MPGRKYKSWSAGMPSQRVRFGSIPSHQRLGLEAAKIPRFDPQLLAIAGERMSGLSPSELLMAMQGINPLYVRSNYGRVSGLSPLEYAAITGTAIPGNIQYRIAQSPWLYGSSGVNTINQSSQQPSSRSQTAGGTSYAAAMAQAAATQAAIAQNARAYALSPPSASGWQTRTQPTSGWDRV